MLKIGQNVREVFGSQVMQVIGFEPELIENVITQWEDQEGTIVTAKFPELGLEPIETA